MTWVRRSCVLAFLVGATAWMLSSITNDHQPVKILVAFSDTHGIVASDVPRLLAWAVLVGLGVRALR
ncbi:hypothetical protein INN71_12975 [Nocardioides sp. ChNu-153]|uniref:hypothetical protein n=1 Tax=unclassified Nocardioides TaxID=2615069 RepID=UPI0024076D38|nr:MULTISPECIES: hypothetical protein [unclassified Nocardioides]MDF9715033.1 hypothetical protein [Nocardioides sp. ChNu-99]MDN7122302.1 hypothetical protein [Nocardioides sp. ChNu-153]